MDLPSLIDELDVLIKRAVRVPGGKVLVDQAVVLEILEEMRLQVTDEVRLGQRIASERERILSDARTQARRILEDAQTQGQAQIGGKLDEHALVQAARQRAKEIQTEAEQRAAALHADAAQYAMGQLNALEGRVQRILREVQAGQRVLAADRSDGNRTEGSAS